MCRWGLSLSISQQPLPAALGPPSPFLKLSNKSRLSKRVIIISLIIIIIGSVITLETSLPEMLSNFSLCCLMSDPSLLFAPSEKKRDEVIGKIPLFRKGNVNDNYQKHKHHVYCFTPTTFQLLEEDYHIVEKIPHCLKKYQIV